MISSTTAMVSYPLQCSGAALGTPTTLPHILSLGVGSPGGVQISARPVAESLQLLGGLGRCPCEEAASWILLCTCPGFEPSWHLLRFPLSLLTQGLQGPWDHRAQAPCLSSCTLCPFSQHCQGNLDKQNDICP